MNTERKALFTAVNNGCRHLMLSYYYDKKNKTQLERYRKLGLHIFMDSGAYSAWKKKIDIDIEQYINFLKDNHIGKYIVLDVVGDPEKTYTNLKYMESNGLQPIPVFHLNSDFKYLERLVNDGYCNICLGGTVGASTIKKENFFDECFNKFPEIKFHALGMSDPKLILKYPWFSIDSTSWLAGRKNNKQLTLSGQKKFPEGIYTEEKIAINVRFLRDLEKIK